MKNSRIILNNKIIQNGENDSTIFLQQIDNIIRIHFVEYQNQEFKKRIEFIKRKNLPGTVITFSINIEPDFVFSGRIGITERKEILEGEIEILSLKPRSTSICETYSIKLNQGFYFLEHIKNPQRKKHLALHGAYPQENIDIFLFEMIGKINNRRTLKRKVNIPTTINLRQVWIIEQEILRQLEKYENPEAKEFIREYIGLKERRRIREKEKGIII